MPVTASAGRRHPRYAARGDLQVLATIITRSFGPRSFTVCTPKLWNHRRRSGWTSGGTHGERWRWVRVEWGGIWGGFPLSSRLSVWGERRELPPPQRGPGRSPVRKRILAYFEGHRTLIFVLIWQNLGGGAICISVPPLQILGGLVSPVKSPLSPVIYAHVWNSLLPLPWDTTLILNQFWSRLKTDLSYFFWTGCALVTT